MNNLKFPIAVREAARVLVHTTIVGCAVWVRVTKQTALTVIGGVSHTVNTSLGIAPSFVRDSIAKHPSGQNYRTLEYKRNGELIWSFDWNGRILRIYCSEG